MASLITPQFERYVAEQTIARGTVQFDEFIFANIPGLNENNLEQYLTMPTSAQIVHRQAVSQSGVINENAVVYSVTIGTEVGDFDFNFIGLINSSKNLLAVAVQTDTVKKIRNKNAVQGNSITRNMLLEFSGAKALTGINVNANTWQIDFTVRLHGLDEKIRLTNRDLYGRAVFFDDSFLVKRKTGNQFTIQPGTAYVEGVRMDLGAEHHLTANSLPCSIYADVVHHCTVTGEYQTEIKYLTQSKADYLDTANRQHYVQILADIDSQGNVTDRRLLSPFLGMNPLTLDDTTENTKDKLGHTHKLPIASLVKKGIVKLFSGYDSDAEDMAATPKAIKGLKALIDAITRNLGNYIPNSKKSSRVDSNSADDVATSAAVKTAYDKGVDAKTAADNAQRTASDGVSKANAAQTSANQAKSAADTAQRTASDANNNANTRQLKSELIGEVAFFARTTPPNGWLKANGAAVSRTTYAALFSAIGTTFGAGDGRTTFNLPDLRGEFIRCLDDGRNVDGGRRLGTTQGDAIRNIAGHFGVRGVYNNNGSPHGTIVVETNGVITSTSGDDWDAISRTYGSSKITTVTIDASRSVPTAAENRPRNIALLACIKY